MEEARQLGMETFNGIVVRSEMTMAEITDLINHIRSKAPDLVIADLRSRELTTVVQAAKTARWDIPALTCMIAEDADGLGSDAEYITYTTNWVPSEADESSGRLLGLDSREFAEQFRAMFQQEPTYQAAATFASGIALIHAIEECNCLHTAGIIAALRTMSILTEFGLVSFDENGQNKGGYVARQLRFDQNLGTSKLTSSKNLIYPMPSWESRLQEPVHLALLVPMSGSWPVGPQVAGAAALAVERVNANKSLMLKLSWANSGCNPTQGLAAMGKLLRGKHRIDAVIGPGCSSACVVTSYLARGQEIPQLSWGCTSPSLSDKKEHPLRNVYNNVCRVFGTQNYCRNTPSSRGQLRLKLAMPLPWCH